MPNINDQTIPYSASGRTPLPIVAGIVTVPATTDDAVVVTLTGNVNVVLRTPPVGYRKLDVIFLQDAAGGRTVGWATAVTWLSSAPTVTATPLARTRVQLLWDGGVWYESELAGNAGGVAASYTATKTNAGVAAIEQLGTNGIGSWTDTGWYAPNPKPMRLRVSRNAPDEGTGGTHFQILPYQYGMAIEYPGNVECFTEAWSLHVNRELHTNDGYGAVLWVGNNDDTGGLRLTATKFGSEVHGDIFCEMFNGATGGSLRFTVHGADDRFQFRSGVSGAETTKAQIHASGAVIPGAVPTGSRPSLGVGDAGAIIYDTSLSQLVQWTGTKWEALAVDRTIRLRAAERSDNLWPDGFFMSGNLDAFTPFQGTFSFYSQVPVGRGGVQSPTAYTWVQGETFAVDVSANYLVSAWLRGNSVEQVNVGIACVDIDGHNIEPHTCSQGRFGSSALTTLAANLNPGNTTVTLASASGWATAADPAFRRGIAWFPYVNSFGYAYPDYTYAGSNNAYQAQGSHYPDFGYASVSGNVLTLTNPWAGPALPTGTKVANFGSDASLLFAASATPTSTWAKVNGNVGVGAGVAWRDGTAFARPYVLMNYSGGTGPTYAAGLQIVRA